MAKFIKNTDNSWMSFSDIMTGLMIIFMFIAISYIDEVQIKTNEIKDIVSDFVNTKSDLHSNLKSEFLGDFERWAVELDSTDLSIKFTNPEILFESGQTTIRPYFAIILDDFIPRYFEILLQEKYQNKIAEIRIEGHTDTVPAPQFGKDPYIGNVKLSQLRSAEVLKYFRNMKYYQNLQDSFPQKEQQLQFWLTANGLSYGRTLDNDKKLSFVSKKSVNNEYSRRVEFRIITTSDTLVNYVNNKFKGV
jgi:outer membrane protein OmpA-like peptidoglycan-associated protein